MQPFFAGLARVPTFVPVDPRRPQRGKGPMLSGAALTQYHMDRSEFVLGLLLREYGQGEGSGEDAEAALLGELQLAFLIFLQLSSLRSLEQWKVLVHTLCSCEQLLLSRPGLYVKLFPVLRAQLLLAPRDFFEDELSADNFLRASLSSLASLADGHQLHAGLEAELERLWKFVLSRFGLGRSQLLAEQLGEDEDPVVVAVTEDGEQYP
uniref:AAR2 C-terminal domain-containing protein n=1 Tax=Haptolina ericina TaxID=156174 RepID=A0A7S3ES93_9EUKA